MSSISKDKYNDIPVLYCKNCLSLNIKNINSESDIDFCDKCGSTDIEQCHIEKWRSLYIKMYGKDYSNNK